jgi:transposase InsO family protein
MWKALRRAGEQVPRCQVQRLMRSNRIVGAKRRGKPWRTTRPDPEAQRRPDLVQRDFTASRPNALWCADFTYLRCWEGPVFFAFVLDVYSRMIVGWQFAAHMRTDLVLDALTMAVGQRLPEPGLLSHSDRGSQYTSDDYQLALHGHGIECSMSGKGNCWDNACVESFFATLKRELLHRRSWPTRKEAAAAIHEYVEVFYNRQRLHSTLGYKTPAAYESYFDMQESQAA